MKKIFQILVANIVFATVAFSANAQTLPSGYREAVSELYAVTHMRELSEETATIAYDSMGLEFTIPTSEVVHEMYDSIWDKALDDYAQIYAKYYTLEELRELCEFYKTPLGEKVNKCNPAVNREKLSVMDKYMQEITPILQKYIKTY